MLTHHYNPRTGEGKTGRSLQLVSQSAYYNLSTPSPGESLFHKTRWMTLKAWFPRLASGLHMCVHRCKSTNTFSYASLDLACNIKQLNGRINIKK